MRNDSAENIDDAASLRRALFPDGRTMIRPKRRGWHEDHGDPPVPFSDLLLGHLRAALVISRDVSGISPAAALVAVNPRDFREIEDVGKLQAHLSRFLTWSAVLHGAPGVDEIRVHIISRRGVRRRFPEIEILFAEDLSGE